MHLDQKTYYLTNDDKNVKKDEETNKQKNRVIWPYIPDHSYRILIIGGSESGKINALLNLINNQLDIGKKGKILIVFDDMIDDKSSSNRIVY